LFFQGFIFKIKFNRKLIARKIAFFNSFVFETALLCAMIIGKTSPFRKSLQGKEK